MDAGAGFSADGVGTEASPEGAGAAAAEAGAGSGSARKAGNATIATATTLAITRIGPALMGGISLNLSIGLQKLGQRSPFPEQSSTLSGNSNLVGCPTDD